MKRLLSIGLASIVFTSAWAGQTGALAKTNPMVGTWKLVFDPQVLKKVPKGTKMPVILMMFKSDGTMTGEANVDGKKSTMKGTYRIQGNKVTMKNTHRDGKPHPKPKEESVTLAGDKRSFEIPGSKGMGKMVKQK